MCTTALPPGSPAVFAESRTALHLGLDRKTRCDDAFGTRSQRYHLATKVHSESRQNTLGAFHRYPVIFVSFVAAHLRLVDAQAFGQFALTDPSSDANGNQQPAQAIEIMQFVKVTALQPFVALDFLPELFVKRTNGVKHTFDLLFPKVQRL